MNQLLFAAGRALTPAWVRERLTPMASLIRGPLTYKQDGLATIHNCDFLQDPRFRQAYALGEATGSWGGVDIQWRAFIVCWAAERGLLLEGDFVECGVNRGGFARTVIDYCGFDKRPRKFYLVDTFSGLLEKYISPEEAAEGVRAGGYEECYDAVKATFAPFQNVVIVRGEVPEILPEVPARKVAFLSIDMNCAAPEVAAAGYFWDKLSPGAVMVLDDYGWPGRLAQKRALDQFAADKGTQVLSLPTGQGLLFKP